VVPVPVEAHPGAADAGGVSPEVDRPSVIIVEDEQTVRSFLRDQLVGAGYDVHAYQDGPHAETGTALLTSPPGLLIADFVLPGSTGLDVADNLRRRWPALKVLFMSAYAATAPERRGHAEVCFLTKPFNATTLTATVREMLAR
jgi:DNA-binding response OmpR family regulator